MAGEAEVRSIEPFMPELDVATLKWGDQVDVAGRIRTVHSVGVVGNPPQAIVHWMGDYKTLRDDYDPNRSSEFFLRAVGAFKIPEKTAA